jgi:hypothetical protein
MSSLLPESLLHLVDHLVPPLNNSSRVSSLLVNPANDYVLLLKHSICIRYKNILSNCILDSYLPSSYDQLRTHLTSLGHDNEDINNFLADFAELILISCFSCPRILEELKLLPSQRVNCDDY